MIEAVVGLLMFVCGDLKEARIQENMAKCLRHKREAERQYSKNVRYTMLAGEAETELNIDGSKSIKKLSSNKVAKHLRDRRYRQIVIKNKKAYDRKKIRKISDRDS